MSKPKLDHNLIHRPVKATPGKPNYGLHLRPGGWYLLYYDAADKTRMMWLDTNDVGIARRIRDKLYAAAAANGRGPISKLQSRCRDILSPKGSDHGLLYTVQLGKTRVNCKTLAEAQRHQRKIAAEILLVAGVKS